MDIWTLRRDGEARPFIDSPFSESYPNFSPDGRWVAYRSNINGQGVIYVTPFPGPGARIPISSGPGSGSSWSPAWSRDGRELFYRTQTDDGPVTLKVLSVEASREFTDVRPKTLFEIGGPGSRPLRGYDASPDGQRFLIAQTVERRRTEKTTIHLVQNWFEELERLVPKDD